VALAQLRHFGRHPQLRSLSTSDRSFSTSTDSAWKTSTPLSSNWANSPQSAKLSPVSALSPGPAAGLGTRARCASELEEEPAEAEAFGRVAPKSRHPGSVPVSLLTGGIRGRATGREAARMEGDARGSAPGERCGRDQGIFTSEPDLDSDFPMRETCGLRQLHLDDKLSPSIDLHSPPMASQPSGTKRKAPSSPSRDPSRVDRTPQPFALASDGDKLRGAPGQHSATRPSPFAPAGAAHGLYSSTASSGLRNGSYASSSPAGFSVADGGLGGLAAQDQLPPGDISPYANPHADSPYAQSLSLEPSLRDPNGPAAHHLGPHPDATERKPSSEAVLPDGGDAPRIHGNAFICSCCPKKPRKFDTAAELE
jgi:hypothetical protein